MPTTSPKKVAVKLQTVVNAWGTLRPSKSFAGMTLEQFKAQVQPSLAARDQLVTLRSQTTDNRTQRHQSDDASLELAQLVVNSVKGDIEEGGKRFPLRRDGLRHEKHAAKRPDPEGSDHSAGCTECGDQVIGAA